jgi:hypothetical protein
MRALCLPTAIAYPLHAATCSRCVFVTDTPYVPGDRRVHPHPEDTACHGRRRSTEHHIKDDEVIGNCNTWGRVTIIATYRILVGKHEGKKQFCISKRR